MSQGAASQHRTRRQGRPVALRLVLLASVLVFCTGAQVVDVRSARHRDFTRVVFETDEAVSYAIENRSLGSDRLVELSLPAEASETILRAVHPPAVSVELVTEGIGTRALVHVSEPVDVWTNQIDNPPRVVLDLRLAEPVAHRDPEQLDALDYQIVVEANPGPARQALSDAESSTPDASPSSSGGGASPPAAAAGTGDRSPAPPSSAGLEDEPPADTPTGWAQHPTLWRALAAVAGGFVLVLWAQRIVARRRRATPRAPVPDDDLLLRADVAEWKDAHTDAAATRPPASASADEHAAPAPEPVDESNAPEPVDAPRAPEAGVPVDAPRAPEAGASRSAPEIQPSTPPHWEAPSAQETETSGAELDDDEMQLEPASADASTQPPPDRGSPMEPLPEVHATPEPAVESADVVSIEPLLESLDQEDDPAEAPPAPTTSDREPGPSGEFFALVARLDERIAALERELEQTREEARTLRERSASQAEELKAHRAAMTRLLRRSGRLRVGGSAPPRAPIPSSS